MEASPAPQRKRCLCKCLAQHHFTSVPEWLFRRLTCQQPRRACHSTYSTKMHSSIRWSSRQDLRSLLVSFCWYFFKRRNNNTPSTKSLFVSRLCSVSFEEQFFHVIVVASLPSRRCWNAVIWYAAVCRPSDAGRNSSTQVGTAFQQPHSHQVKVSRLSFIMSISPKSRHKIEPSIKKCKRNRSPNRICFWAILHSIFTR